MEKFGVQLDNPVYLPGQSVTGNVAFCLKSPENIRGIYFDPIWKIFSNYELKWRVPVSELTASNWIIVGLRVECVGKSRVYWSESRTKGRETDVYHYQACEHYIHHKTTLCGNISPWNF